MLRIEAIRLVPRQEQNHGPIGSSRHAAAATHDRRHGSVSPLTQKSYVRAVKNFSKFFRQSQDRLTFEHVRAQLHLVSRGLGVQAINQTMCPAVLLRNNARQSRGVRTHSTGAQA